MQHSLYYSNQCPNCKRFIEILNRTSAMQSVQLLDIDTMPPAARDRILAVPTLQLSTGTIHTGSKAFEWLRQFQQEMELENVDIGTSNGLSFASIEGEGYVQHLDSWSAFEVPP